MTLEEKVEQYKLLKQGKKTLEKRLLELRQDIVPYLEVPCNGLERQVRDLTTFDEHKVHQLMDSKGVPRLKYCYYAIHPDSIEALYHAGVLSDSDLRYIRAPKYTYALIEVGDADVQIIDEGDSEGV